MKRAIPRNFSARFFNQQTDRRKRLLQYALPTTLAAILLLFCGMPRPPTTLDHAPASSLHLLIEIDNQYAPTPGVTIRASFSQPDQPIILSGKQRFECEGVSFPQTEKPLVTVQRQPPDSAYNCIYIDEQDTRTSVSVAVPQGAFAITSPTAGASVPIPASTHPSGTPSGTPTPPPNAYDPDPAHALTIQYTLPVLPPKVLVPLYGRATCGINNSCGVVDGPSNAENDGRYSFSDLESADGRGFDQFIPGPGSVSLSAVVVDFPSENSGFASVSVIYKDTLTIPVTWTR